MFQANEYAACKHTIPSVLASIRALVKSKSPPPDQARLSRSDNCLNHSFAYAEIRTVSANILSRFDVEEVDHKKIHFRQYITMQFHDGKWNAKLTPRWSQA